MNSSRHIGKMCRRSPGNVWNIKKTPHLNVTDSELLSSRCFFVQQLSKVKVGCCTASPCIPCAGAGRQEFPSAGAGRQGCRKGDSELERVSKNLMFHDVSQVFQKFENSGFNRTQPGRWKPHCPKCDAYLPLLLNVDMVLIHFMTKYSHDLWRRAARSPASRESGQFRMKLIPVC